MSVLRPAETTEDGRVLWARVVAQAGVTPGNDDAFREALLRRVVSDLASSLADAPGIATLAGEVEAGEQVDGWYGAQWRASELGWEDKASQLVLWLLSEKTTSGEAGSPYFHAMGAAAATLDGADVPELNIRAATLCATHGDLFSRFILAQRVLTARLLKGISEVPLHRGDVIAEELPRSPVDPVLWPLASFAVDFGTAKSFAFRKANRVDGTPVVYSAIVPTARIAATPATGFAVGGENEVVLGAGNSGDRATVTGVSNDPA